MVRPPSPTTVVPGHADMVLTRYQHLHAQPIKSRKHTSPTDHDTPRRQFMSAAGCHLDGHDRGQRSCQSPYRPWSLRVSTNPGVEGHCHQPASPLHLPDWQCRPVALIITDGVWIECKDLVATPLCESSVTLPRIDALGVCMEGSTTDARDTPGHCLSALSRGRNASC